MKAFPNEGIRVSIDSNGHRQEFTQSGMDLRDYFAGLAMQAIISNSGFYIDEAMHKYQADQFVGGAYYIADRMMEARENAK